MSLHQTNLNIRRGLVTPVCSCGEAGKATPELAAAEGWRNVHLSVVGEPTRQAEPEVWARRYRREQWTPPAGDAA
jgi:hypothetical protein